MADLLNEQEQVDALKRWWKSYGTWFMLIIIVILLIMLGYRFWQNHQQKVNVATSTAYNQLLVDVQQNQLTDAQAQANVLMQQYPHSIYASLAALVLAQIQLQQNQTSQTVTTLQWIISNGKDSATVNIAKIRLARVLLSQNQAQQTLTTLQGMSHDPFVQMLQGDAYVLLKQYAPAKQAYQNALSLLKSTDPLYDLVQMKLANLPQG